MVVTLEESAIFMGRHFYQGRSIRRHLYSFIHSASIPITTNTDHNECAISIINRLVDAFKWASFTPDAIPSKSTLISPRLRLHSLVLITSRPIPLSVRGYEDD